MTIGCNIWIICLKLNWYFYGLSRMFQLPQFVWALRSSVWDVFINFLLIDATDRRKISSDQKHFFIALSLYPLSNFTNTPFKQSITRVILQGVSRYFEPVVWSLNTIFLKFKRRNFLILFRAKIPLNSLAQIPSIW